MCLLPQNLFHRFSFGEFIDQFVQIADLLHQRVFDFLHANAAHDAFDQRPVWIQGWRLGEKGFKVIPLFELLLQSRQGIASQPADGLVDFFLRAIFAFRFLNVERL